MVSVNSLTVHEIRVDPATLGKVPALTVYSGAFLRRTPIQPPKWLIPGLIPKAVPMVLAAKGGLGKTFLMLEMLVALATGKPFLDFEAQAPMGAVYFGLEDDFDVIHRRVDSIIRAYEESGAWSDQDEDTFRTHFQLVKVNWKSPDASTYLPDLMTSLEDVLGAMEQNQVPPGAMVLDTLARFSDGDENKVEAVRPVLAACFKICTFGFTPIVNHHVAKGQEGARTGKEKPTLTDRMSVEWLRGSSAIVDNFRGVMLMTPILEGEAEPAGLDPDKARLGGYAAFGAVKLNAGQKADYRLLEQDEAGRWYLVPNGEETLAKIRGSKAVAALDKQTSILAELARLSRNGEGWDRDTLARQFYPDMDPNKAKNNLKGVVSKLRKAGYLVTKGDVLTLKGMEKVQLTHGGIKNA